VALGNPFLIVQVYLGLFLSWVLIPRKVAFYYYPTGCEPSLAVAYCSQTFLKDRWARYGVVAVAAGFLFLLLVFADPGRPQDQERLLHEADVAQDLDLGFAVDFCITSV
jgi:hypothetical protein